MMADESVRTDLVCREVLPLQSRAQFVSMCTTRQWIESTVCRPRNSRESCTWPV